MLTSVGGAGIRGPGVLSAWRPAPLTRVWMRKGTKRSEGLGLGQGPEQVGASSRQPPSRRRARLPHPKAGVPPRHTKRVGSGGRPGLLRLQALGPGQLPTLSDLHFLT